MNSRLTKRLALLALVGAPASAFVTTPASDPVGVYALIDKVVLEPDSAKPTAVQIWGVFALSDGKHGDNYLDPVRGYLYYKVGPKSQRTAVAEWRDLKSLAARKMFAGFGGRYEPNGRIRRLGEAVSNPDPYPESYAGIVTLLDRHLGPSIARQLKGVPTPVAPADDTSVPAGKVVLVAQNARDSSGKYVFEIEGPGLKETSSPLQAGAGSMTKWGPSAALRGGNTYTWRVWTVEGNWKSPPASATFRTGK
jgi:hypothetical protein